MKKFAIAFFLPFYLLLLSGEGQLHAGQQSTGNSSIAKQAVRTDRDLVLHSPAGVIKSDAAGSSKVDFTIEATENEIEEDELVSSRKHVDGRECNVSLFSDPLKFLVGYRQKTSDFNNHLFHTSSRRYLLFEVFRL